LEEQQKDYVQSIAGSAQQLGTLLLGGVSLVASKIFAETAGDKKENCRVCPLISNKKHGSWDCLI